MTDPTAPDGADALDELPMDVVPDVSSGADSAADVAVAEMAVSVVPDRADAPVSEITERFLRAILATVPLERIEELHLFAPLRQGGAETGIAVVAARVIEPAVAVAEPLAAVEMSEPVVADSSAPLIPDSSEPVEMIDTVSNDIGSVAEDDVVSAEVVTEDGMADAVVEGAVAQDAVVEDAIVEDAAVEDAVVADAVVADAVVADAAVEDAVVNEVDAPTPIVRHTVYTARYRLVLKGAERGKWETDVVDEADAPLVTVETVVRGVQRRAGEETEILRYSDRQIARALRMEWPTPVAVPTA
jgi:hypothetical protein